MNPQLMSETHALAFFALVALGFPPAFPVRGAVQRGTELIQFTGVFFVCHLISTRAASNKRPALDGGTDAGLQLGHQPPGAGEVRSQPRDGTKLLRSN